MDMFMDKLAQKLTAQEIIKANTAAETEELNHLRSQIKDYNECLTKLQKLIDEGAAKLSRAQTVNGTEVNRLVEESVQAAVDKAISGRMSTIEETVAERIGAMDRTISGQIGDLDTKVSLQMGAMDKKMSEQAGTIDKKLSEQAGAVDKKVSEQLSAIDKVLSERLDKLDEKLETQPDGQLSARLDEVEENVHKECVKVYRNVQAVVVEESEKQSGAAGKVASDVNSLGGKLGVILGVSVASLIFSLASVILQILNVLNIKLF